MSALPGLVPLADGASMLLIDAARVPGVVGGLGGAARSLYQGPSEVELADVAPYLVPLSADTPVRLRIEAELWGQSALILLTTTAELDEVRQHLRRLLMVLTEDGKTLYFRFYDPRVLRVFLPTCDGEQLARIFGPVAAFVMEAEDPATALRFTLVEGALTVERIDLLADPTRRAPLKIDWKGRT